MLIFPTEEQEIDSVDVFFTSQDSKSLDMPRLIKKWQPVIDSDIGGPVLKENIEHMVASLEMQLAFNKETPLIPKYKELQQYSLPIIRRFYGDFSHIVKFNPWTPILKFNEENNFKELQADLAAVMGQDIEAILLEHMISRFQNNTADRINGLFFHITDTRFMVYT